MRKFLLTAALLSGIFCGAAFADDARSDKLFQVALLQSLMQGEYDGMISVGELKTYGDTGIGTFQGVTVN